MTGGRESQTVRYDSPLDTILKEQELAKLDIDADKMRKRNIIGSDEMFIGVRVIATNVRRALPTFVQYLEKSHRQLVLTPLGTNINAQKLEQWFTDLVRHEGWQLDFYRQAFSGMLHGRGIINVLVDATKPSGLCYEYVACEDFLFPLASSMDIQESSMLARRYNITYDDLDKVTTAHQLDPAAVAELNSMGQKRKFDRLYIYHIYTKIKGVVHCCWWTPQLRSKLLRKWYQFANGTLLDGQPAPVMEYPFFLFLSQFTSETRLLDVKGRGFEDVPIQDAQSSLLSSMVNSTHHASQLYPYLDDKMSTDYSDIKLEPGKIFKSKLGLLTVPQPPASMLGVVQHLASQSSQDAGQISFAASNRKDSRRTAKELALADEQETEIDSVPTMLFGMATLKAFSYIYNIVVSRVLGNPAEYDQEIVALCQVPYNKRAAGDIDFVERKDKLDRLMRFWPVISNSPALAPEFLKDLVSLAFPAESKKYLALLDQPAIAKEQLIMSLVGILRNVPAGTFSPQEEQQIAQIISTVEQSYGRPGNTTTAAVGAAPNNQGPAAAAQ